MHQQAGIAIPHCRVPECNEITGCLITLELTSTMIRQMKTSGLILFLLSQKKKKIFTLEPSNLEKFHTNNSVIHQEMLKITMNCIKCN